MVLKTAEKPCGVIKTEVIAAKSTSDVSINREGVRQEYLYGADGQLCPKYLHSGETMMVQIEHVNSVVRWYKSEEDLAQNKPYLSICSMFWLSPNTVFIYGMLGTQSKEMMIEFFEQLVAQGVDTIFAERKGKMTTKDVKRLLKKAKGE